MAREKFIERRIPLQSNAEKARAVTLVQNALIDESNPLEVVLRERVEARKLSQNNYMWKRIGEISEQAFIDGRRHNSDVWHEYFRRHVMPEEIKLKDGTLRSKWIELPLGGLTVVSSTDLEKGCFANYCTLIEAFGAERGVRFSANPNIYKGI